MNDNALSVIEPQDAMDDFPVLKAFQQYIDNEQAKARKRLLAMGVFFGFLLMLVVAVFVMLLINVSQRNQTLNDRLVEYAMKDRDRDRTAAPVVVQPPQDNSVVLTLTSKLEEMQKQLAARQAEADRLAREAAEQAAKAAKAAEPKVPTAAELELKKLKAELKAVREKAEIEKTAKHQAELEAYRRQHYPELYADKSPSRDLTDVDAEIDDIVKGVDKPISYFEESSQADDVKTSNTKQDKYSVPVDVKKSSTTSKWRIPTEY